MKHDTMTRYVADRAPRLAPRTVWDRIDWTAAAVAQDARQRAAASLTRPVAPIIDLPAWVEAHARRPVAEVLS